LGFPCTTSKLQYNYWNNNEYGIIRSDLKGGGKMIYDFEKELSKTSKHMTKMKKKYGNKKFKSGDLFGFD
jgi:hypothetical protein